LSVKVRPYCLVWIGRPGQHWLNPEGFYQSPAALFSHPSGDKDATVWHKGRDAQWVIVMFAFLGIGVGPPLYQFPLPAEEVVPGRHAKVGLPHLSLVAHAYGDNCSLTHSLFLSLCATLASFL
jgi:hypothetical protein